MTTPGKFSGGLVQDNDHVEVGGRSVGTSPQRVSTAPSSSTGNRTKVDQMLESQMISDLLRANGNLKALKQFRINNERHYHDKAMEDARRKEIREPLENAMIEIDLLQGKIHRREDSIRILRKQVYTDILRTKGGQYSEGEHRKHIEDMHVTEENKLLTLTDQLEMYKILTINQQRENAKYKRIMSFQQQKIKEIFQELEKTEFYHDEQIRKIENDKQIYLNMIESRENKIEALMEEKDEISEALGETEIKLKDKLAETKRQQQKLVELEAISQQQAKQIKQLEETLKSTQDAYTKSHHENEAIHELQIDLQHRYDNLVMDLDRMVEAGYYIPDPGQVHVQAAAEPALAPAAPPMSAKDRLNALTNSSASFNSTEKRRSKGGVRLSDVHKAMKSQRISKRITEDSTISTDSGNDDDSVTGPAPMLSRPVAVSRANSMLPANSSSAAPDSRKHSNNLNINTALSPASGNVVEEGTPTITAGRFTMRKMEEESTILEKISAAATARLKDTFQKQIVDLEAKLKHEQEQKEQERKKAITAQDTMTSGHRILNAEVSRLTNKLGEMEKTIADLKDELNVSRTTNSFLSSTANGNSPTRHKSSLFMRLSNISIHSEAEYAPINRLPDGQQSPVQEHCSIVESVGPESPSHGGSVVLAEEQSVDKGNTVELDMLAYMYDWENVRKHSKETQVEGDLAYDMETQYHIEDFLSDEQVVEYYKQEEELQTKLVALQKLVDQPAPPPEVIVTVDESYYKQLEELYTVTTHLCGSVLPKTKMDLLSLDFSQTGWQHQLVSQQLLAGLDINWQVKQALALIVALNEIRNAFVKKYHRHHNQHQHLHSGSKTSKAASVAGDDEASVAASVEPPMSFNDSRIDSTMPNTPSKDDARSVATEPENDLRITLAVRLVDAILQSLHHILSPIYHVQRSSYPEVERMRAISPLTFNGLDHAEHFPDHLTAASSDVFTNQLQEHARMIMQQGALLPRPDTFPLTATPLTADPGSGVPKGILLEEPGSPKYKRYMNSTSPRNLPTNIDEVLDMLERTSRSNSPLHSRHGSRTPSRSASPTHTRPSTAHREPPSASPPTTTVQSNPVVPAMPGSPQQTPKSAIRKTISRPTDNIPDLFSNHKAVSFTIDASHEEQNPSPPPAERKMSPSRDRAHSKSPPHGRPPLLQQTVQHSALLRTLLSKEKESHVSKGNELEEYFDYTRYTFDRSALVNSAYGSRAKTAGGLEDAFSSKGLFEESVTSNDAAGKGGQSELRSHSASSPTRNRVGSSSGGRKVPQPLKFTFMELDTIESVGSVAIEPSIDQLASTLQSSVIIPKPKQPISEAAVVATKSKRPPRPGSTAANGKAMDADDFLAIAASAPAPVPLSPFVHHAIPPTGPPSSRSQMSNMSSIKSIVSQKPSSARAIVANRPTSSTPSTKYYSPRIQRNIVFPQADAEVVGDLADTSIFFNVMDDPRIVGANGNHMSGTKPKTAAGGNTTGGMEFGLSVTGQSTRPSTSKERVTGAALFM